MQEKAAVTHQRRRGEGRLVTAETDSTVLRPEVNAPGAGRPMLPLKALETSLALSASGGYQQDPDVSWPVFSPLQPLSVFTWPPLWRLWVSISFL